MSTDANLTHRERRRPSTEDLADGSFRLGFRFQRHWDLSMASAFFCGELGAGVFLVSAFFGFVPGMALGLLVTAIGKPLFHFVHMGVPARSWRAILRPDRSWVSRGLIAIVVFCGASLLHIANLALGGPAGIGVALLALAGAAAVVVMTYQGFAMSHSAAIGLWSSAAMPLSSALYALTSGAVIVLLLDAQLSSRAAAGLAWLAVALLSADLVLLASLLHAAYHGAPGARVSAELLVRTRYRWWFLGVVVGVGIALPAVALWAAGDTVPARSMAAVGALAGFYAFRVLVFKAGVYEPVLPLGIA